MKLQLFSLLDMKSRVFLTPFTSRSVVDAERQIVASMRDPQIKETPIGAYPEDFFLYHLGSFDDESGAVDSFTVPVNISSVKTLVMRAMPDPSTVAS